jgi:transposase
MFTHHGGLVIGVDTHRDTHAYAVCEAATGRVIDQFTTPATATGYAQAHARAADTAAPGGVLWAIEGTSSYGHGLTRMLTEQGEHVAEVDHPHKRSRQGHGKTDAIDAIRAAQHVIAAPHAATPRHLQGPREALRVVMIARDGAINTRTDAIRQARAIIIGLPDGIRQRLSGHRPDRLLHACAGLRVRPSDPHIAAIITTLRAIGRRGQAATGEAAIHKRVITRLVTDMNPELLRQKGVGAITAAALLVAWSHPGRLRNEACFARLAGVAPIPASTGATNRHRLDRAGDRKLNNALHTIATTRARCDPETLAYIQKRMALGKTRRDAIRSLKRHIARGLFRLMERTTTTS